MIQDDAASAAARGNGWRSSFFVYNNPELPTCEALRLRDHIGIDNLGYHTIFGNDDAGTCP